MDQIVRSNNNFQDFGWERSTLESIEYVSKVTGIEAWASTGLFNRPFLNGKFGINQRSFDKDICVKTEDQVRPFWMALRSRWPEIKWSVFSGDKENSDYGVFHPLWMIQFGRPLLHRLGVCRMDCGKVEFVTTKSALDCLQEGRIELNPLAVLRKSSIESGISRASKMVQEYPFLVFGPNLKALIMQELDSNNWLYQHALNEKHILDSRPGRIDVNFFYQGHTRLPEVFERIKEEKFDAELRGEMYEFPSMPTEDRRKWSQYFYQESDDRVYKEWLSNQFRNRKPYSGVDDFVGVNKEIIIPEYSLALSKAKIILPISFSRAVEFAALEVETGNGSPPEKRAQKRIGEFFNIYSRYSDLLNDRFILQKAINFSNEALCRSGVDQLLHLG